MGRDSEQSAGAGNGAGYVRPPRAHRSRRDFLGALAGVATVSVAGVVAEKVVARRPAETARTSTVRPARPRPVAENSLPGDPNWTIASAGGANDMLGYVNPGVITQGQPVTLYGSTTASWFTVDVFRMGWYGGAQARLVYHSPSIRGLQQAQPAVTNGTNTVSTNWGDSVTLQTDDWPAGIYLLRLNADTGPQRYVPMVVVSPSTKGTVAIKAPVATWQAYNTWGGYDLYNGPGGTADYDNRSLVVSLDRPYDGSGAVLFLSYDQPLIALVESLGLPLSYISNVQLDSDPTVLDGAAAMVSTGHDEYWTTSERATATAARDAGVNLAFMGANCCFRRIRLQDSPLGPAREVVCYKTSYTEDPMYGVNNAVVTNDYREPPDPDPESSMTGTLYESNPAFADYVVASPDSWAFAGTGVQLGQKFGGLVGIEYDRVNPDAPVNRPIQVLSHSPLTCRGINSYADSAYYTTPSGAGVFNTGSMRWVPMFDWQNYQQYGITQTVGDFAKQVTSNVLKAFAEGPAAEKYPAEDNLDAMQEWAGDPIASQHNLWPPVVL